MLQSRWVRGSCGAIHLDNYPYEDAHHIKIIRHQYGVQQVRTSSGQHWNSEVSGVGGTSEVAEMKLRLDLSMGTLMYGFAEAKRSHFNVVGIFVRIIIDY